MRDQEMGHRGIDERVETEGLDGRGADGGQGENMGEEQTGTTGMNERTIDGNWWKDGAIL